MTMLIFCGIIVVYGVCFYKCHDTVYTPDCSIYSVMALVVMPLAQTTGALAVHLPKLLRLLWIWRDKACPAFTELIMSWTALCCYHLLLSPSAAPVVHY